MADDHSVAGETPAERRKRKQREYSRRYRQTHADAAEQHLQTLKGKPRKAKRKQQRQVTTAPVSLPTLPGSDHHHVDGDQGHAPQAAPDALRTKVQAQIARLETLAASLDLKINTTSLSSDIRLRADVATRLIQGYKALSLMPAPKPTGSLASRVTERWLASKAAQSAALPATPEIAAAPMSDALSSDSPAQEHGIADF